MSNLSDDKVLITKQSPVSLFLKLVDGALTLYKGSLLNYEAANIGYVKAGSDTLSEEFAGILLEAVSLAAGDNASDGDNSALVLARGCGELVELAVTSTITIANEGDVVYVDGTGSVDIASGITNTTGGAVGTIRQFISANNALVQLDQ